MTGEVGVCACASEPVHTDVCVEGVGIESPRGEAESAAQGV